MAINTRQKTVKIKLKNGNIREKKITQYRFNTYYTDGSGARKRKASKWFDSKEECEKAEYEFKNQDNYTSSVTIGLVGHKCMEDKKERVAASTYKDALSIFDTWFAPIHDVPIDKVKPHQIKQCFEPYLDLSTSRKNKGYDVLHSVFEYAITYYGLSVNPMKRVPRFQRTSDERLKQMDIWSYDQFMTFYEAIPDKHLKYKAFFHLLYFTGLRKNEALSLTWKEFDGKSIKVWRQWRDDKWTVLKTKNSQRTVSLDSVTIRLLNELKEKQMEDEYYSDNWFMFYKFKPMSLTATTKIKDKIIEQTGLPYIRIHDLRHSHASYLIKNGANMYAVSRRLGHSSIQMTIDRYTHLIQEEVDPIVQLMESCANRVPNSK